MRILFERFFLMPFVMEIIVAVSFIAPVLALTSTLWPPGVSLGAYGLAANLLELVLTIASTIPASVVAVLMLMKKRAAVFLWPLAYLGTCISPFFLSVLREDFANLVTSFWANVPGAVFICAYLCLSPGVKRYFYETERTGASSASS